VWLLESIIDTWKETLYIKIRDGNPSTKSTRQKITQVDTTWRKNKSKQSTKKKEAKDLKQKGFMATKWQSMIVKKT